MVDNTEAVQATAHPTAAPMSGMVERATSAYTATLNDPSIIGPTAPACTERPWLSQTETIVVKNIAGKTETTPAAKGLPKLAIQTHAPIASAANPPLQINTLAPTRTFPFGAA